MSGKSERLLSRRPAWLAAFIRWEAILVYILLIEVIVFSSLSPYFLDAYNLFSTTLNFTERAIVALPMILVIVAGDIDISVAGIMAMSSLFMGMAAEAGASAPVLVAIGLVVGLAAGLLNGVIITYFEVPSIAVAIGAMSLYRGVAYAVLGDKAYTSYPMEMSKLGQGFIPGTVIPWQLLIFAFLAVGFWFLLHKTRFGRETYAIGNNRTAAEFAGVDVRRHRIANFALTGLMSGLAAVLLTARILSTRPNIANSWELMIVTVVVLGGVSISGGKGTVGGVVLAVFVIGLLRFGMGLVNVPGRVMDIVSGILLIVAILVPNILDRVRRRRAVPAG